MSSNAFDVLQERGFVQQVTFPDELRQRFDDGPVTLYVGYDPTAESLHVGHLFTLMALMHLERLGHKPIVVLGGGTAMVGDPSGKTELRKMLSKEAIDANVEAIRKQIAGLLDLEGKSRVVNNAEWLLNLSYIEFLRDIGRHFSVNRMLSAESYKQRLERGLSFLEFNYQLLQAYDFLQLHRRYGCNVQMGGDDQWGNILAGVDLIRRVEQQQVFGMTFPLLLTATGEKMGKTAAGAVWLDAERLSPYEYYQYWVNVHDADVEKLLGYFTFLPIEEIRKVKDLHDADLNTAKSILAYEATAIVHGQSAAREAHAAAQAAFGGRKISADILPASSVPRQSTLDEQSIPTTVLASAELQEGIPLADALVRASLCGSKKEARRKIAEGAVRVNGEKPTDERFVIQATDLRQGVAELRLGKKKVHRLKMA